ncbi:hypothetical protein FF38_01519 [Lucilia cuprina]|uniref:Uncharacterized protein n=1 Tax=Lucilia cuprina TaxID=7375 RepID=A0A0L0CAE7_LUCCU|nr:hypothetical protein FF38_01519 [Lucilia cuprina]
MSKAQRLDYDSTNGVHNYNFKLMDAMCSLTEVGGSDDMQRIWHHYYVGHVRKRAIVFFGWLDQLHNGLMPTLTSFNIGMHKINNNYNNPNGNNINEKSLITIRCPPEIDVSDTEVGCPPVPDSGKEDVLLIPLLDCFCSSHYISFTELGSAVP